MWRYLLTCVLSFCLGWSSHAAWALYQKPPPPQNSVLDELRSLNEDHREINKLVNELVEMKQKQEEVRQ